MARKLFYHPNRAMESIPLGDLTDGCYGNSREISRVGIKLLARKGTEVRLLQVRSMGQSLRFTISNFGSHDKDFPYLDQVDTGILSSTRARQTGINNNLKIKVAADRHWIARYQRFSPDGQIFGDIICK